MSVNNGQPVSAEITNAAFMSRTQNTDTVGRVDLLKPSGSGPAITDLQGVLNTALSTLASHVAAVGAHGVATVAGLTETQSFSNKTFSNKTNFSAEIVGAVDDILTAGSAVTIASPVKLVNNLTGALTSLSGITSVTGAQPLILVNKTGGDVTVKNEDATATAANRIITGTSLDLTLKNGASLWAIYDTTSSRWRIVGGSGSGGSTDTQNTNLSLSASGTISISTTDQIQTWLIAGNSAAVTLSLTPFGTTAPVNGAEIVLIGNSLTDTVTFSANDASKGILGYGFTLSRGQVVTLKYNSTLDRYVIKSAN